MINSYPSASPDGRHIAFASIRNGESQIFVMNADGSGIKQLTWDKGGNVTPSWSPNGAMITFASNEQRDGSAEIYVMNADGSNQRRLTNNPADDSHPHWSPDSRRIIFCSSRTSVPGGPEWDDIFSMTVDGTGLRKHTDCPEVCTFPSYSGTDGMMAAEKSVWEAWKAKDAKRIEDLTADDITFVNIFGTYFANKADVIKDWTGATCAIKSFSLTDGVGTFVSATVGILTVTGSVDGNCGGQKPPRVYGTTVYVKDGDAWKWAFGFNSPG